jgi:probable addiction module antidote protein
MATKIKISDLPNFDMADYLKTDEDVANYLNLVLEENDPAELNHALGTIARARGMTKVASSVCTTTQSLSPRSATTRPGEASTKLPRPSTTTPSPETQFPDASAAM